MTVREMFNSASDDAIASAILREGIKKFLQSEATKTKADRIKKGR